MASTMLAVELGIRIRRLRSEKGWSQRELARRIGLASKSVISYYELGDRFPSYENLIRLADVFCVTTDYLLRGSDTGKSLRIDSLTNEQIDALNVIVYSMNKAKE